MPFWTEENLNHLAYLVDEVCGRDIRLMSEVMRVSAPTIRLGLVRLAVRGGRPL